MRYLYLLLIVFCFSCNNERILQLPEIENAKITEILDVSPAYIFYDETEPDSTLLNRKNLIISTNWLVNVDKRLTLKQAIPHIKFLQDKKQNAELHKNEAAKNYFTCNDTRIGNLGFLEFTDVNYTSEESITLNSKELFCHIMIMDLTEIYFNTSTNLSYKTNKDNIIQTLKKVIEENGSTLEFLIAFNSALTFQDYISFKAIIKPFEKSISKIEFIFHP